MKRMLNNIQLKNESINIYLLMIIYLLVFAFLTVFLSTVVMVLASFMVSEDGLFVNTLSFIIMSVASILVVLLFENSKILPRFGFELSGILKKYSIGYLIGTGLIVVSALPILIFFTDSVEFSNPIPASGILLYFLFFLIQGASEEIMVRGMFFPLIVKKSRPIIAIVATSGLFSLLHIFNPGINFISIFNLFLAGVLFGYCVMYFDSLWQACALHSAWNFIQGNILGFEVSGLQVDPLLNINVSGNPLFTGGAFGVEGSIFCTFVLIEIIVFLHLGCEKKGIKIFAKTESV